MSALVEIIDQATKLVNSDKTAGVPDVAAVYVVGLLDRRPFSSGRNFVTAIKAVYLVAALNGWAVDVPESSWAPFLADVARGDLTTTQVAGVIAGFLRAI